MDRCYQKDMLKKVLVRTDFSSPVALFKEEIPKKIKEEILELFPIPEKRDEIIKEIEVSDEGTKEKVNKIVTFSFSSLDRTKRVVINCNTFFIEYDKYETFDKLRGDYFHICNSISTFIPDCKANRFGLRYINNLEINEPTIFEWTKYINDKLIQTLTIHTDDGKIIRDFHNTVTRYSDDSLLTFQYGMYNPDFPAFMKKKVFVLDYDISISGLFDNSRTLPFLESFHVRIEHAFENSIKDELRKLMDVKDE